ncbi:MAG: hypothetical protein HY879_20850 [Deltaproteobacteria bacterium]|nr:hypothetical protein [Deltaproteobacteria bacterium]
MEQLLHLVGLFHPLLYAGLSRRFRPDPMLNATISSKQWQQYPRIPVYNEILI